MPRASGSTAKFCFVRLFLFVGFAMTIMETMHKTIKKIYTYSINPFRMQNGGGGGGGGGYIPP